MWKPIWRRTPETEHKGYGGTDTVPSYGNGLTHTHASARLFY